jgi:hypothetical protein
VGVASVLAPAVILIWMFRKYTVDDAFISFRYAEHWAGGSGPVYNLGERVEGYTNFAWVALLALANRLGLDVVVAAKVGGVLFALLTLALTFRLAARLHGGDGPLALLAPVLLATNGTFFRNAVNGLETVMFGGLALLAVSLLDDVVKGVRSAGLFMGAVLAALVLTRPDGILWVGALGVLALLPRAEGDAQESPVPLWKVALPWMICLVALGLHELWRIGFYGQPLPNTYYAKLGGQPHLDLLRSGGAQLYFFQSMVGGIAVLCACMVAVVVHSSRLVRALAVLIAIRIAFVLYTGGQAMEQHRFLAPCLPMIYLLLQAAASGVWHVAGKPRIRFAPAALVLAPLVGWNLFLGWISWREASVYASGLQNAHVALGQYLASHSPPDAVVAVGDAGAIPYYSGRKAIDLYGLNDATIARLPGRYGDKFDIDYLWSRRPDYIVIWSSVPISQYRYASGRSVHDNVIEASERFRRDYAFVGDVAFQAGSYHLLFRRKPDAR